MNIGTCQKGSIVLLADTESRNGDATLNLWENAQNHIVSRETAAVTGQQACRNSCHFGTFGRAFQ